MNQIVLNNKKITPSKVICINPDTKKIYTKPNTTIGTILNVIEEDNRGKSRICFLIKDEKIAGIGLALDIKYKANSWEDSKDLDNSTIFSDFVSFDADFTKLKHELSINDELKQKSSYDTMIDKPEQLLEDIKNSSTTLNDGDIIMINTLKGVSIFEECDLFMGTIYCDDEILVEACWEAI